MEGAQEIGREEKIPLDLLRECAAFGALSEEELAELSGYFSPIELPMGTNLFAQGDPPGPAYLVEAGKVRVLAQDEKTGKSSALGLRVRGDLVGERALLTRRPRMATIRAAEDSRLWRIQAEDLEGLLARHPELRESLTVYFEQIGLRTFLKAVAPFAPLPPEKVRLLASRIERHEVPGEKTIVVEGEPGDSMYFVSSGEGTIYSHGRPLRALMAGSYFGERSLLTGEPRAATVVAKSDMVLYRLGKPDFDDIVQTTPAVRKKLLEEMEARLQEEYFRMEFGVTPATTPRPSETSPRRTLRRRAPRRRASWLPLSAYPVVLQRDEMDCGAAALATALAARGIRRPLSWVRECVGGSREGSTLESLVRAAEAMGFETRVTNRTIPELAQVPLPSIAYWDGNHYMVLFEARDDRVLLGDPAAGLIRLPPEEFLRGWTGILIELEPTPALSRREIFRENWVPLWRWLAGLRGSLALWVALAALEAFAVLVLVLYGESFFARDLDRLPRAKHLAPFVLAGAAWALTRALRLGFLESRWARWIGSGMDDYLRRLLAMPERFFERMTLSDLMLRSAIGPRLWDWVYRVLDPLFAMSLLGIFLSIDLVSAHPLWGAAVVAASFLAGGIWHLGGTLARPSAAIAAARAAEATSHLTEVLARNAAYRLAGLVDWTRSRWLHLSADSYKNARRAHAFLGTTGAIGLLPVAAVWLAALAYAPVPLRFLLEALLVPWLVWRTSSDWPLFWQAQLDLDRILEVLAKGPSREAPESAGPGGRAPRIELADVSAKKEIAGEERWLRSVSLVAQAGTSLAVVGPPRCGRWQILELVQGSLSAVRGEIRTALPDGAPLADPVFHTVVEEPVILPATVRENVRSTILGKRPDQDGRYAEALDLAGLRPWLRNLPLGDATRIGPGGFPAGLEECQRIQLARAILGPPDVLLLYKPLWALDEASRWKTLQGLIERLRGRVTILFVPKSVEEARLAERVAVLYEGRLVENGTHAELAAGDTFYRRLLSESKGSRRDPAISGSDED
ncbi:MAG: cyclic nucleotide-binding domain-containing protein [Planctomycetes bacterium]|nr:cyclic nucleotide-binding domain-containing protein [Planctomycetota bacterium]